MTKPTKDLSKVAGGLARAAALSKEERSSIGVKGAAVRWGQKVYTSTHRGNFFEHFGVSIECYVLNDPTKTAVISQRGMGQAIGFSRRGSRLTVFASSQTMAEYIGRDLRGKIENPLVFQASPPAAGNPLTEKAHGYDVTILIDLCQAIIAAKADGKLSGKRYSRMAEQAQIVMNASAKSGIQGLVYRLAGYVPSSEEVIAAFKAYVQEEARKYGQEFPSDLYVEWHRLYKIPVPVRGKPWQFKHLTVKHIYYPLAKSNGKILELIRAHKSNDGDRQKKLFQFLNEIGARALRIHIGRVLEMAESSKDQLAYEHRVAERFGEQREFDFAA